MGLLDFFRRRPPIRTAADLAEFIDQHAAFVTQKGIYEYARARAGHYAKALFGEAEFQAACDVSRWRIFPMSLAMVGELVEGVMLPVAREGRLRQLEAVQALVLAAFDRYPVPMALGAQTWSELRAELESRLRQVGLHPPKSAKDIPEPFWEAYFNLMPIHEKMRSRDAPTTRSYLRVTMIEIHSQLTKRLDVAATVESLRGSWNLPPLHAVTAAVAPN